MLKVLYISPNGYLGGAERFVVNTAKAHFKNKKIQVAILFFSEGEACIEAREAGIQCFVLKSKFRLSHPLKLLNALSEIRKIVKSYSPSILQMTMPYSHIVLSLATWGLGIKKVWFQHGPVGGRLDQIANLFPVDMIWYNGNYLKKQHHQTWPKARVKKEYVVKYGIKSFDEPHEVFNEDLIKLGMAGRICSWKGFHHIITALGELNKTKKINNLKLYFAGSAKTDHDKIYEQMLKDKIKDYELSEVVEILSHVKDMNTFYSKIDVFIHASTIPEPFGLVVAEAMASGCFVIGSNVGGVTDILLNEETGLSFSSTTDQAANELQAILNVIESSSQEERRKYKKMAHHSRNFIRENYSEENSLKQIESLYQELAD